MCVSPGAVSYAPDVMLLMTVLMNVHNPEPLPAPAAAATLGKGERGRTGGRSEPLAGKRTRNVQKASRRTPRCTRAVDSPRKRAV